MTAAEPLTRERIEELSRLVTDDDGASIRLGRDTFKALLAAAMRDADVRELDEWARTETATLASRATVAREWTTQLDLSGACCHLTDMVTNVNDSYDAATPSEARRAAAAAIRGSRE